MSLQERARWNKIGGIILIIILAVTELITWSGLILNDLDEQLGASAIAFAVFGGMSAALLFRARAYSYTANRESMK